MSHTTQCFRKHKACIATQYGWVNINQDTYNAINCVTNKLHYDILTSTFYKDKENVFWPHVEEIHDYKSNYGDATAYFKTEYLHNIVRYPEFTALQFKESLLFLCDVCNYCQSFGYWLRTHLWNVTFVRGNPYLIDIRDFESLKNQNWTSIFKNHLKQNTDNHCPVHASKFIRNYTEIYDKIMRCANDLKQIRKIIIEIKPTHIKGGKWSNYHGKRCDFLHKSTEIDDQLYENIKYFKGGSNDHLKSMNLFTLIEKVKPESCIEVGCSNGLYTFGVSK